MRKQQKRITIIALLLILPVAFFVLGAAYLESYSSNFDADYVGSEVCGECHTLIYPEWQRSPPCKHDPGSLGSIGGG